MASKPRTLVLVFPMPPNLANSRMHWRVKHKAKVRYWELLDNLSLMKQIPYTTLRGRVSVSSAMTLKARMDQDNAMARHKWVMDWLTTRAYWADDSDRYVHWTGLPTQTISRKLESTITLTLTELS